MTLSLASERTTVIVSRSTRSPPTIMRCVPTTLTGALALGAAATDVETAGGAAGTVTTLFSVGLARVQPTRRERRTQRTIMVRATRPKALLRDPIHDVSTRRTWNCHGARST